MTGKQAAAIVRRARRVLGMSAAQCAVVVGVDVSTFGKWARRPSCAVRRVYVPALEGLRASAGTSKKGGGR